MNIIFIEPSFPYNQKEFVRGLHEDGYMANAWLRVRHPDYDTLRHILDTIGETVKVHAA